MIKLQTYLAKSPRLIELASWGEYKYRQQRYLPLDDINIANIIGCKKFDFRYCSKVITISYNGESVVDFDKPAATGGGLWLDYLTLLELFIDNKRVSTHYGIDYFKMSLIKCRNNEVRFSIYTDFDNEKVISAILPQQEFIQALIAELKHIWNAFDTFGLFDQIKSEKQIGLGEKIRERIERCEQIFASGKGVWQYEHQDEGEEEAMFGLNCPNCFYRGEYGISQLTMSKDLWRIRCNGCGDEILAINDNERNQLHEEIIIKNQYIPEVINAFKLIDLSHTL